MQIRTDRSFRYAVDRAALWTALRRVDRYQDWWPWLHEFDGRELSPGTQWRCAVRPPLRYSVRFALDLVEVVDGTLVRVTIDGDITGWAALTATEVDGGSELRLVAELTPTNTLLRLLGWAAGPLANYGHDWVLDTGARQFGRRALGTS